MNHTCDRNDHINRNHMDMCKFSGPRDPEYAKVHGEIKRHITRLRGLVNRERESQYAMPQMMRRHRAQMLTLIIKSA